jgi:hypothetical protein
MLGHAPIAGAPIAGTEAASSSSAQYVVAGGDNYGALGDPLVTWNQIVLPVGFAAGAIGALTASWRQYVGPIGFDSSFVPSVTIIKLARADFNFNRPYTPPAGDAVWFDLAAEDGEVRPRGEHWASFGTAVLTFGSRYLLPSGLAAGAIGTAVVTKTPEVFPTGIPAGGFGVAWVSLYTRFVAPASVPTGAGFGTATVINYNQEVRPVGFNAFAGFGTAWTSHLNRTVAPAGIAGTTYGTARLESSIRYVDPPPILPTAFGTAKVEFKTRTVFPFFVPATVFGLAAVDRTHFVDPTGFEASAFGVQWVHDNTQFVDLLGFGFKETAFGDPRVSRSPQVVTPQGYVLAETLPSERWGLPEVVNMRRYVTQIFSVTPSDGGVFGSPIWMTVENRNRNVKPDSWDSAVVSRYASVENTARAVDVPGLEATAWGANMVAFRIRDLPAQGFEAGYVGNWLVVYNNARLAPAQGFVATLFGTAGVENTRRYFGNIGAGDQSAFGDAFTAFRVRTVAPYFNPDTASVSEPLVWLSRRYVEPASIGAETWGTTIVYEHFNLVAPRFTWVERVGEPFVHNRNFTPMPYGYDMSEFGRPIVDNRNKYVEPPTLASTVFGAAAVEYRTKTIRTAGINAGNVSPFARAAKTTPDPPAPQPIATTGFAASLYGTASVRTNVIYPSSSSLTTLFGAHTVRANSIFPHGIFFSSEEDRFGDVRSNKPRSLFPVGIKDPWQVDPTTSKPRISPHTIYCTFDVTTQAVLNNGGRWVQIDENIHTSDHPERPVFGTAFVSLGTRRVTTAGHQDDVLGVPSVDLKNRKVAPLGMRGAFGVPRLNYPQTINVGGFGIAGTAFSEPVVTNPWPVWLPRTLAPAGMVNVFGQASVDLFNREIQVAGWSSLAMGTARVHPPEPVIPKMGVQTLFGTARVEFRIRSIAVPGADYLDMEAGFGAFRDRMRVRRRAGVTPASIVGGAFGAPKVELKTRNLIVDSLKTATPFGAPRVSGFQIVALGGAGFEATAMGTPAKWQEGDPVAPYGPEMTEWGVPRLKRTVAASGFLAAVLGAPVAGPGARPQGFDASAIGAATLTHADNSFVCGSFPRGLPMTPIGGSAIGNPTVA